MTTSMFPHTLPSLSDFYNALAADLSSEILHFLEEVTVLSGQVNIHPKI